MDAKVKNAMGRIDRSLAEWRICQAPWQTIRARIVELEAENERLQSRLAAVDVGTIKVVIAELRARPFVAPFQEIADKLTRAIGNVHAEVKK